MFGSPCLTFTIGIDEMFQLSLLSSDLTIFSQSCVAAHILQSNKDSYMYFRKLATKFKHLIYKTKQVNALNLSLLRFQHTSRSPICCIIKM